MKTFADRQIELISEAINVIKDYLIQYKDVLIDTKNYSRVYWDGENAVVSLRNPGDGQTSKPLNEIKHFEILVIADALIQALNQ